MPLVKLVKLVMLGRMMRLLIEIWLN